jgi:hypothetical protein
MAFWACLNSARTQGVEKVEIQTSGGGMVGKAVKEEIYTKEDQKERIHLSHLPWSHLEQLLQG